MKVIVLGASPNPERYSYMAVKELLKNNYEVIAIGNKKGFIENVEISLPKEKYDDVHTISIYLSPQNQKEYYHMILNSKPKRVIFNPGTENSELKELLIANDIEVIEGCTIVMLKSKTF